MDIKYTDIAKGVTEIGSLSESISLIYQVG